MTVIFDPATMLGVIVPVPPALTGMVDAATAREGVVVALVTVGVNHEGHEPTAKLVTVPDPLLGHPTPS